MSTTNTSPLDAIANVAIALSAETSEHPWDQSDTIALETLRADLITHTNTLVSALTELRERYVELQPNNGNAMTNAQGVGFACLLSNMGGGFATVQLRPFDLPDGYVYAVIDPHGRHPFHAGIAPDGSVSS